MTVDGQVVGQIAKGLLLLIGFCKGDDPSKLRPMAEKVLNLRVFEGEKGSFDRSVLDIQGEVLTVSQFTLYADPKKGRRPDFAQALDADTARTLYTQFCALLPTLGVRRAASGVFQAHMLVASENDGPVTILIEL